MSCQINQRRFWNFILVQFGLFKLDEPSSRTSCQDSTVDWVSIKFKILKTVALYFTFFTFLLTSDFCFLIVKVDPAEAVRFVAKFWLIIVAHVPDQLKITFSSVELQKSFPVLFLLCQRSIKIITQTPIVSSWNAKLECFWTLS